MKRLWSLIGLLLMIPWAKLLTAVGLIDLPGQVREWSNLLGFLTSTIGFWCNPTPAPAAGATPAKSQ